jgi:hypothetical protein
MKIKIKMKLILLIILISSLTCKFLGRNRDDDEEEGGIKPTKNEESFVTHFINELMENNVGDIGRGIKNDKFNLITEIVSSISTEFGLEKVYPIHIFVNKEENSKVELSFSVSDMEESVVKEINEKFEVELISNKMEYQVAVK